MHGFRITSGGDAVRITPEHPGKAWQDGTYLYYYPTGLYENTLYAPDDSPLLEPCGGYWVRGGKDNVFLRFPTETSVLTASAGRKRFAGLRFASAESRFLISSLQSLAIADDEEDSLPMPAPAFEDEDTGDTSGVDAAAGCFISAAGE